MEISDRIKMLAEYSGCSIRAFALKCGLNQPTVDRYVKKLAVPTSKAIIAIASSFPEISCEWLLLGEGHMLKSENEAARLNKLLGTIEVLQESIELQKDTIAILKARNVELENKLKNL